MEEMKHRLHEYYQNMPVDSDQVWKVLSLSIDRFLDDSIIYFCFVYYRDCKLGLCATSELVLRMVYQVWLGLAADDALLVTMACTTGYAT